MIQLKGKSDIGDKINTQIIQPLIEANQRLARSDFPDFNDPNKLREGKAIGPANPVEVDVLSFSKLFERSRFPMAVDTYQRGFVWDDDKLLHSFGNLALVSRNHNSRKGRGRVGW